jgi:hypothetical protein
MTISNPTLEKVVALSGVLGVETGHFLDGGGEPPILFRIIRFSGPGRWKLLRAMALVVSYP